MLRCRLRPGFAAASVTPSVVACRTPCLYAQAAPGRQDLAEAEGGAFGLVPNAGLGGRGWTNGERLT